MELVQTSLAYNYNNFCEELFLNSKGTEKHKHRIAVSQIV